MDSLSAQLVAKQELKAIGITLQYDADLDEYRVNLKGDKESTAYYTPDLDDAIGTGKAMANHKR